MKHWQSDWLTDWLTNWLSDWKTTDWMTDWLRAVKTLDFFLAYLFLCLIRLYLKTLLLSRGKQKLWMLLSLIFAFSLVSHGSRNESHWNNSIVVRNGNGLHLQFGIGEFSFVTMRIIHRVITFNRDSNQRECRTSTSNPSEASTCHQAA